MNRRRGSIFIAALAVLLVLTSLALVFARSARIEGAAAANHVADLQAQAVAQGAAAYVLSVLAGAEGTFPDEDLVAEAVAVGPGYFWLLKPVTEDGMSEAFGLIDETGKINVNHATPAMLEALPNMTAELAAAIVDWRDADETPLPGGAEGEYYLMRTRPYQSKNDRLETVEELLLVKDITLDVLAGRDGNRNGVLDPGEDDTGDGSLDRGLYPFVTVHSGEPVAADGSRVNVNSAGREQIAEVLGASMSGSRLEAAIELLRASRPYRNLLDVRIRSGLTVEELRPILSRLTTGPAAAGLVNLNTAPWQVLACLPGLDESDARTIVTHRESTGGFQDVLDLADVLPAEKAVEIGGLVSTQTWVCSADIVAVSANGRSFRRYLVVFDARQTPRIVYWRDLTSLGWPLDRGILDDLRMGQPPVSTGIAVARSAKP